MCKPSLAAHRSFLMISDGSIESSAISSPAKHFFINSFSGSEITMGLSPVNPKQKHDKTFNKHTDLVPLTVRSKTLIKSNRMGKKMNGCLMRAHSMFIIIENERLFNESSFYVYNHQILRYKT